MSAAAAPPRVAAAMSAPHAGFASANPGLGNTATMRLSAAHFVTAMVFLLAGSAGLSLVAPELAAGRLLEPRVAAVTHLFTLGWLTTTILGALYQLLPVALGTPLRSIRAGYASIALLGPGVALFVAGVAASDDPMRHAGIALVMPALLIAIVNIGVSLRGATRRDVTWWSVALAIASLLTTIVLGGLLVHNLKTGMLGAARVRVLAIHMHIALGGWALAVMIGMSQRLLPMFLLSHGVDDRWARRALVLLAAGLAVLTSGLLLEATPVTWAGAVLLAGAVAAFVTQARLLYRARVRRRLDAGLRIAATALTFLAIAAVLGLVVTWRGVASTRIATAYGIITLLGAVVPYVIGHFYKIVPFLAWIARYGGRMGRESVPAIADLYSSRAAKAQWVITTVAATILTAGTLAGHAHCARVGSALYLAGVVLLASQMVRVAMPLLRRVRA